MIVERFDLLEVSNEVGEVCFWDDEVYGYIAGDGGRLQSEGTLWRYCQRV